MEGQLSGNKQDGTCQAGKQIPALRKHSFRKATSRKMKRMQVVMGDNGRIRNESDYTKRAHSLMRTIPEEQVYRIDGDGKRFT